MLAQRRQACLGTAASPAHQIVKQEERPAGSPEAQGKAELLMAVISSINRWQGYTVGASRAISHVAGSLSKHRRIIHEASGPAAWDTLHLGPAMLPVPLPLPKKRWASAAPAKQRSDGSS